MTAKEETGLINQHDAVAKDCEATFKLKIDYVLQRNALYELMLENTSDVLKRCFSNAGQRLQKFLQKLLLR